MPPQLIQPLRPTIIITHYCLAIIKTITIITAIPTKTAARKLAADETPGHYHTPARFG